MQQRFDRVKRLEDGFVRTGRLTHAQALAQFEAMWDEARNLGVLPPADAWEGIEVDLRLARMLARCSPAS